MTSSLSLDQVAIDFLQNIFDQLDSQIPFDWDLEFGEKSLTIDTGSGGVFLVNYHEPTNQLWLSSPVTGAHHFSYTDNSWQSTRNHLNLLSVLLEDLHQLCPQLEII